MSEYQYHEWQTIDRLRTPEEQEAVDCLSSHIDVSSSRASNHSNTGRKIASVYDDATTILMSHHRLAEYQGRRDVFLARLYHLARKYASRPALIYRRRRCGWL
jgi:hypothetical protein